MKGQTIKLSRRSVPCCRVLLEDNVAIPKWSEKNIFGGLSHPWQAGLDVLGIVEATCLFNEEYGKRGLFLFPGVVDPTLSRIPLLLVNVSHEDIALPARSLVAVVCPQSKVCTVARSIVLLLPAVIFCLII